MASITLYLPKSTSVSVKEGAEVIFGQVLAKPSVSTNIIYNLVRLFGIKPQEAVGILTKKEGEEFDKGAVLAKKRTLLTTKTLRSTFAGKVIKIDNKLGEIIVAPVAAAPSQEIISPVNGRIEKITNEAIIISFSGEIVFAKRGIGGMKKGELVVLSKEDAAVSLADIRDEYQKKILLGGYFSRSVLEKAFGIGVAAVLACRIDEGDFLSLEEKRIFGACLLLIAKTDYDTLVKHAGKEVIVEGSHKRIIV